MPAPTFRSTVEDTETALGARAFELANAVDRSLERHLEECTDRYITINGKLDDLYKLLLRVAGAIIMLLLSVMGWLLVH